MLITGTRKGIGRYLAEYYSNRQFQVVGCSRSNIDFELDHYKHHNVSVCDEKNVKAMFKDIRRQYGRLDVLINNAGANYALNPLVMVPYESALKTIETNLLGTFLMSREAIKIMINRSIGRIINFSSMAVKHEVKGEAIYTASKSAIISMTRVLAKEVYGNGITCNVIAPAAIDTDLMKNIEKKALNDVLKRNAIQELGKNEDVSSVIDKLIDIENNSITGQTIYLGGV